MENTIQIKNNGENLTLHYDCLKTFHQDTNYAMLAITFKGLQGALKLFQNGIPERKNIKVLCAHPGTGVRDSFEFITRVFTNNNIIIDCTLPFANYNPHKQMGYYFEISDGKNTVHLTLKENILKKEFFDYFAKLQSNTATEDEINQFTDLKKSIETNALTMSPNEIFHFEVK